MTDAIADKPEAARRRPRVAKEEEKVVAPKRGGRDVVGGREALRTTIITIGAKETRELPYDRIFRASRSERFNMIDRGISVQTLLATIRDMGLPQERLFSFLGFARSTIAKKIAADRTLDHEEASLVVGLRRLIGQVEVMVAESGNVEGFDAAKWVAAWLDTPNPALDGRRPAEYMHLPEGQEMLSSLLAQMQSGAYA